MRSEPESLLAALSLLVNAARTDPILRYAAVSVEKAVNEARAYLDECLWDEEPWTPEDLVEQMERVYESLGGSLDGPPPEDRKCEVRGRYRHNPECPNV